MAIHPVSLSDRPDGADECAVDVFADVLRAVRFSTLFFGRFELGAPWAMRVPRKPTSSFYVVAAGGLRLEVEGEGALHLSAGEVVLLPGGPAHVLDDGARPAPRGFVTPAPLGARPPGPVRLGGPGPVTTLVSGCFRLEAGGGHPLLRALPRVVRLRARGAGAAPGLAATVELIALESEAPGPGSEVVLGRLADVLLVHALRARGAGGGEAGLRALADPAVGAALGLLHARP
ncbi:MAG TPA: cupin domain-containing protein, partial [Polyangiaceae bacterium]|nr:cupin domain-containing protein [Polyangiaceae bacterium]